MFFRSIQVLLPALVLATASVHADSPPEFTLVIKGHRYQPAQLTVPANTKVVLIVDNQDSTPEEFESHELNREKVIPAGNKARIFVGPLAPGKYPFFGDFHQDTAQGVLVAQ